MQRWMIKLRPLAVGGVTLGWLQGFQGVDFNQIWSQFLLTIVNLLVTLFFGGDLSTLSDTATTSPFASLFL